MFGYVLPDKPNMLIKDFNFFKAYYCGLCKAIGGEYGQRARFATNYDSTFLLAFAHSVLGVEPQFQEEGCILNPLKKRQSITASALAKEVADITVLLTYYKADDDVFDEGGLKKRAARLLLKQAKRKAVKRQPVIDKIISDSYLRLRKLEQENSSEIDVVADCFAGMLSGVVGHLLGGSATKEVCALSYNLGRWIYLADAVDDLEKDAAGGRYNPIIAMLGPFTSKQRYLKENAAELEFLLYTAYNAVVDYYNLIDVKVGEGVLSNIIYLGLKNQTEIILEGAEKCKTTPLKF